MQEFDKHFSNQSILETTDLDQAINQFRSEIQRTLDQITPEKIMKMRNRNKKPWFDKELYDQRRIMKNRERVWLKYQNPAQWKTTPEKGIDSIPCSNTKKMSLPLHSNTRK